MISPRRNEVAAVEALLNDESFEDGAKMARAIVIAVVDELAKRDTHSVGLGLAEDPWIPVGPFYGQGDVTKFTAEMAERGWTQIGGRLWSPESFRAEWNEPDPNAPCECGHHKSMHHTGKAQSNDVRGCGFPILIKGRKTTNKKCPCSGFKATAAAA